MRYCISSGGKLKVCSQHLNWAGLLVNNCPSPLIHSLVSKLMAADSAKKMIHSPLASDLRLRVRIYLLIIHAIAFPQDAAPPTYDEYISNRFCSPMWNKFADHATSGFYVVSLCVGLNFNYVKPAKNFNGKWLIISPLFFFALCVILFACLSSVYLY